VVLRHAHNQVVRQSRQLPAHSTFGTLAPITRA
jgi:hypothetical protein